MTITLFPHQERGVEFLSSSTGTKGLFFGMGTGKTLTALYAAKAVKASRSLATRVLVIAPPIALPMWQREATAHLADAAIVKSGTKPLPKGAEVLVVSYGIATNAMAKLRDWLAASPNPILICDESHALKSVKAKRTVAILGRGGIASAADYIWMLTGTPVTRWNNDLYPFLCRADLPGLRQRCGGITTERFALRYTIRKQKQWPGARFPVMVEVANQNTDELAAWMRDEQLALRVDLDEVFASMPPLTINSYTIPMDLDAQDKAWIAEFEKLSAAQAKAAVQAASGGRDEWQSQDGEASLSTIRRIIGAGKVKAAAAEIIERIESGQNILVGAWHTDVIDDLEAALSAKGYSTAIIDGRESAASKQAAQDAWNAGEINALICQISAAGVSLNLQHGGSQIVIVEEDWSPSIMDQFYARLWRYGQEKHVHVDILRAPLKLEEAVAKITQRKAYEHARLNRVLRDAA